MSESRPITSGDRPRSAWERMIEANPDHSRWYAQRFKDMAAAGKDLAGEARTIDAMVPRRSRILDAGCGSGRVGGELARRGHTVVGVDVDAFLIDVAHEEHPDATWLVGDLFDLDLPAQGIAEGFDAVVCAGNVMTFLAEGTAPRVLERIRAHLRPDGRAVIGFGAGRGYEFSEFLRDAASAGLAPDVLLSTWDLRPFEADSGFLVAILRVA